MKCFSVFPVQDYSLPVWFWQSGRLWQGIQELADWRFSFSPFLISKKESGCRSSIRPVQWENVSHWQECRLLPYGTFFSYTGFRFGKEPVHYENRIGHAYN